MPRSSRRSRPPAHAATRSPRTCTSPRRRHRTRRRDAAGGQEGARSWRKAPRPGKSATACAGRSRHRAGLGKPYLPPDRPQPPALRFKNPALKPYTGKLSPRSPPAAAPPPMTDDGPRRRDYSRGNRLLLMSEDTSEAVALPWVSFARQEASGPKGSSLSGSSTRAHTELRRAVRASCAKRSFCLSEAVRKRLAPRRNLRLDTWARSRSGTTPTRGLRSGTLQATRPSMLASDSTGSPRFVNGVRCWPTASTRAQRRDGWCAGRAAVLNDAALV